MSKQEKDQIKASFKATANYTVQRFTIYHYTESLGLSAKSLTLENDFLRRYTPLIDSFALENVLRMYTAYILSIMWALSPYAAIKVPIHSVALILLIKRKYTAQAEMKQ